jgi:probable phosphoglycerate mutase
MKRLIAAAAFLLLAPAGVAQTAVYIVRHAEKVAEDMNHPSTELAEAGKKRAQNLATILRDSGVSAIYVTDTVRSRETARPLAEMLGITPHVYEGRDAAGLVQRIRKDHPDEVVLVVGHENTVGDIARALGFAGRLTTGYGNLYAVVPRSQGATVLRLRF